METYLLQSMYVPQHKRFETSGIEEEWLIIIGLHVTAPPKYKLIQFLDYFANRWLENERKSRQKC